MKKVYKYVVFLIIFNLITILFTMCSSNEINSKEEIKDEVILGQIDRNLEESIEPVEVIEVLAEENKRDYRTNIIGNNEDIITIMIYMCGSDLESQYGSATPDLNEILAANISDKLNVIIETGGCKDWTKEEISEEKNQIFKVQDGNLVLIKDDVGLRNMADPNTLTDFINYSKENYPANRYGLIIWNHGLGTLEGFGKDENFSNDNMELYNLANALETTNTYFDFIGFDACFMSTIEVAYTLKDYADYLIASSEIEPFAGWYYTNWITELSNNTSMNTVDLGKLIIDDFVIHNSYGEAPEKAVLTITDLTEIDYAYEKLCNLLSEAQLELNNENYDKLSLIRSEAKTFSNNLIDHIDIISLAESLNLENSKAVIEAINNSVKYNGRTSTMEDVGGLSLYFPYYKINYFNKFKESYLNLELSEEHFKFINDFTNAVMNEKIQIIGTARSFDDSKEAEINRYGG